MELEKNRTDILAILHEDVCEIVFTKANGENRNMWCTLKADLLPPRPKAETDDALETKRKMNDENICVWDLEKEAWRSFKVESLISIKRTH